MVTGRGSGAKTGTSGILVIEADESDGSFLAYTPDIAVVTNVEPDHLDHYGTPEAVEEAFAQFAGSVRPGGLLIACADDAGASRLAAHALAGGTATVTYGFDPAATVRLTSADGCGGEAGEGDGAPDASAGAVADDSHGPCTGPACEGPVSPTRVVAPGSLARGGESGQPVAAGPTRVVVPGSLAWPDGSAHPTAGSPSLVVIADPVLGRIEVPLPLPARHVALNAAAAYIAAMAAIRWTRGQDPGAVESGARIAADVRADASAVARGLARFGGTGRRFEERGEAGGVRVIDDYAHHPTEVRATLDTARRVAGAGRVFAVFQPHLYSRTQAFAADFAAALAEADRAVILDVYAAREDPLAGVDGNLIAARLPGAVFLPDQRDVAPLIATWTRPGDIVLTLGAGDIAGLVPAILAELAACDGGVGVP
jgi:UDP-N-acetylmuramate--alanine ligase